MINRKAIAALTAIIGIFFISREAYLAVLMDSVPYSLYLEDRLYTCSQSHRISDQKLDLLLTLKPIRLECVDLSWQPLVGQNLNKASLFAANLSHADLRGADLEGADLSQAVLHDAKLAGAHLRKASIRWADLSRSNLLGADLAKADLRWANLAYANLYDVDLRGAILMNADIQGAVLQNLKLPSDGKVLAGLSGAESAVGSEYQLLQLRELFVSANLRDEERQFTAAYERARTRRMLFPSSVEGGGSDYKPIDGLFRTVFLDWPVAYGGHPGRALRGLLAMIGLMTAVNAGALAFPTIGAGISRIRPEDRLVIDADGKQHLAKAATVEPLQLGGGLISPEPEAS
jgi:uncharacterized protein YjbI with pentapeptide repeats